jgi:ABC-type transport system involved in multi-copper enzyme maturation permease subunit
MKTSYRAALVFMFGLLLAFFAFLLAGVGHGTYAPTVANVSVLAFIPVLGILLGFFGAPFLWSLYFIRIPAIVSRARRLVALGLVSLLHLVPGVWLASDDPAFTRALQQHPVGVLMYATVLILTLLCLAFLASIQDGKR